jgi:hypothetical protein
VKPKKSSAPPTEQPSLVPPARAANFNNLNTQGYESVATSGAGNSVAAQMDSRPKDEEFDDDKAEQISKEIVDPFQLLASLWSMVPAVEDQKPRWCLSSAAGSAPRCPARPTHDTVEKAGRRLLGPPSDPQLTESGGKSAETEKSAETKSTNSGSGDGSGSNDGSPPGSSRN